MSITSEIHNSNDSKSMQREIVIDLLLQVYQGSYKEEFFSNNDRGSFYRKLFLSTIRHLTFIDSIIDSYAKSTPQLKVRSTLAMGISQILFMDSVPDYASVDSTVDITPNRQKGFVNWVLMEVVRNKEDILSKHNIYQDFPSEFINKLKIHCTGDELKQLLITMNTPPVPWGFDLKQQKSIVINSDLEEDSNRGDQGSQRQDTASIFNLQNLQNRGIIAMDKGSSMVATTVVELAKQLEYSRSKLAEGSNGRIKVLDACAAPGGKTVVISKLIPQASISAVEINQQRFSTLEKYLQGYHVTNVNPIHEDIFNITPEIARYSTNFATGRCTNLDPMWDITLLDAPCSCTGTVRRHPEVRIIKKQQDLVYLQEMQLKMLNHIATLTSEYLIYSVCSLEIEETQDVIRQFIKQNPNYKLLNQKFILPHIEDSDGFYTASMQRIS